MLDARLPQLLEHGLRHFALGEIDLAVACWRQVLAVEPNNRRAREYLELVASTGVQEEQPEEAALDLTDPTPSDADLLPWFSEADAREASGRQAIDDWLRPEGTDRDLPPVAAGTLPWQEWHSEAGLHGTGELPWNEEVSSGPEKPVAGDPWMGQPGAEKREVAGPGEAWTPGPGSTGWDVAAEGAVVQLNDDRPGDALELLDEASAPPVSVPAALARNKKAPGPSARAEADTLMQGARELYELGDFSGSLELVQKALELQPDHREALAYLDRNQDTLVQMYESKVGSLETRPRVVLRPDEIVWLNLDHRAGFVLAQIDGTITVDDLYALSGLSRLDTAKILAELVEQGVIAG